MGQQAHIDPPIPEPDIDVEVAPMVFDAQSAPNDVVGDTYQTHVVVADPPHEIPLTQNHPNKCLNRMVIGRLPLPYIHFFHSFLISLLMLQETFLRMWMCPPIAAQVHFRDGFHGSNSVEITNDLEP